MLEAGGPDYKNVVAFNSLSKRSNLPGLRSGFAAGDGDFLDTLAEIYFQLGDKDKAIATQKKVIELDPNKGYFKKQLKRIEAGDPKAERAPENDDTD